MRLPATPSPKLGKWLGYSSLATTFLAIGHKAEAQTVYVDVDPDSVLVNSHFDIDFDGDGTTDLTIGQSASSSSSSVFALGYVGVPVGNQVIGTNGAFPYPSVLATSAPIAPGDPNLLGGSLAILALNGSFSGMTYNVGNWNGQSGFVGCSFVAGDGQTHYGWVQLEVTTGATSVTVVAYGYETMPDVGTSAGASPSTAISDLDLHAFSVQVYPNPVVDQARITLPAHSGAATLRLVNGTGQVLRSVEVANSDNYTLDMGGLASGVYFVRLQDGKEVAFAKLTKQ